MNFLSISVVLTTYGVKKIYKNLFADHLRQLSFKIRSKDKFKKKIGKNLDLRGNKLRYFLISLEIQTMCTPELI